MKNNKQTSEPPRAFLRFFRWFCDEEMQGYIEGDLMEMYRRRLKTSGKRKADLFFIRDVLWLFRPGIIKPFPQYHLTTPGGMMRSYVRTGWRNLWRYKLYSALNIIGLTFGMVCFLLIGLYVHDELTFDRHHAKADRIYRVIRHTKAGDESTTIAAAGFRLAEEAKAAIPEVENTTKMVRMGRANLVDPANPVPVQETVTVVDANFFDVFDFPLLKGDKRTALRDPNSILITEAVALRIFNTTEVLGKMLDFGFRDAPFKVTGVLKDPQSNSTLRFTSLISESTFHSDNSFRESMADWTSDDFGVYALLREGSDAAATSRKMTDFVLSHVELPPGATLAYALQPWLDVHLHSEGIVDGARNTNVEGIPQGNPLYVTVFAFAAVFVLMIAGINYTNLTTARASTRLKEMGVRKTIGAVRHHFIVQFLVESVQTTVLAFVFALIAVTLLLPSFNSFVNKELTLATTTGMRFWLYAGGLILLMAFLSGGYAAALLSRFKPVALLKGLKVGNRGGFSVRRVLVVFQFALSTVMIIGTIVLIMQVRFLTESNLGFDKDLMVVIDVNVEKARANFEAVKNEMMKVPSVKQVSVTSRVPGEWKMFRRLKVRQVGSSEDFAVSYFFGVDPDFLTTYGIQFTSGRNFGGDYDSLSVIINETAARRLNIREAADQVIDIGAVGNGGDFRPLDPGFSYSPRVVGIVKDFHFQSLRDKIEPLILGYHLNPIQPIDYYSVKIASTNVQETLNALKKVMVRNDEREPFEYHFLDDQLALFYLEDERRQTLLTWVAFAAIFIACLGLFGLATYATETRVKEIGIRKVLGASPFSLMSLLSLDFVKLVLIANVIAFPVGWWSANRWLNEYAYHVEVKWWVYAFAAVIAAVIALATVSYQALRVSTSNPVNSLRSE